MPRLQSSVLIAVLGNFHPVVVLSVRLALLVEQVQRVMLVRKDIFVLVPTIKPLFAMIAQEGIIKAMNPKLPVCPAFPVNSMTVLVRLPANHVPSRPITGAKEETPRA